MLNNGIMISTHCYGYHVQFKYKICSSVSVSTRYPTVKYEDIVKYEIFQPLYNHDNHQHLKYCPLIMGIQEGLDSLG